MTMTSARLGLEVSEVRLSAVVLDDSDQVIAAASRSRTEDIVGDFKILFDALNVTHPANITEVGVALDHLDPVAALPFALVRIGPQRHPKLGVGSQLRPKMRNLILGGGISVSGGFSMLGARLQPFTAAVLIDALFPASGTDLPRTFVVASTGAETDPADEHHAASVIREQSPESQVFCSSEFDRSGVREREYRAAFNAALLEPARQFVACLLHALLRVGVDISPVFLRNTGGRISLDYFEKYPITAVAAGRIAVQQGAVHLARASGDLPAAAENLVILDCRTDAVEVAVLERDEPGIIERREMHTSESLWGGIELEQPVVRRIALTDTETYPQLLDRLASDFVSDGSAAVLRAGEHAHESGSHNSVPSHVAYCAAAVGALIGEPRAEWQRVAVAVGRSELDAAILSTRRRAISLAIAAGADANAVSAKAQAQPIPYLPVGTFLIRAQAEGHSPSQTCASHRPNETRELC